MMCEKEFFPYLTSLRDRVVILSLSRPPSGNLSFFFFFFLSTGKPEKGGKLEATNQMEKKMMGEWVIRDFPASKSYFKKIKNNF